MIRIAVVDDELFFADRIREIADKFFKDKDIDYEIKVYTHPVELRWDVEDGDYFDIYLIDIEMPGMDGLALAQCIRMIYAEPYIIFVTAHMKYSIKGMGINSIEALRGNRLMLRGIGLTEKELDILGILHAGE